MCKYKRSWCAREQIRLGATLLHLVFIERLEENEVVEQHFVETKTTQMDIGEENLVEAEVQPSIEVQAMAKAQ